jgi:steroid delta-isomerase-like uncharacterized protein
MTTPTHLPTALVAAWNSHDADRMLPFYAPDFEGVDVAWHQPDCGSAGIRAALERYWRAFPDMQVAVQQTLCQGDCLALHWSAEGTHQGTLMHIPPTQRKVQIQGMSILRLRGGLIWRGQTIWDVAGMLRGLGLLPDL